jgi:hypothetical protein
MVSAQMVVVVLSMTMEVITTLAVGGHCARFKHNVVATCVDVMSTTAVVVSSAARRTATQRLEKLGQRVWFSSVATSRHCWQESIYK